MNIQNIGIDLVENKRFISKLDNTALIQRILSSNELEEFNSINNSQSKLEYISSRFAAKEAFSKALGSFDGNTNLTDIEVRKDEIGRPYIYFKKDSSIKSLLSLSHTENYSIAQVIIVK